MGIDAVPALVNSMAGRSLDIRQPSPFAFDHVIVQAKLGQKTYWFDPTISYQRGGLDKYHYPSYERALVLREGSSELEKIPFPAPGSGSVNVKERYESMDSVIPVSLLVATTYFGAEADYMRYNLSRQTLAELSKTYLNYYAGENPSIRADGLPQVEDDQTSNVIVVKEKYLIDEFWKENKHRFVAEKIYAQVGRPEVSQRSMPLKVRYPVAIKQTIEINLPESYDVRPAHGTFSDDEIKFTYDYSMAGKQLKLEYSLDPFSDSIPVDHVSRHLLVLDKIQDFVGLELTGTRTVIVTSKEGPVAMVLLSVVGLGSLVILAVVIVRRRRESRRIRFAGEAKAKVGFAPETAIRVPSETEIDGVLHDFTCDCGRHPYSAESPPLRERFSYDGQRLVGLRLHCADCGRNTDLYLQMMGVENAPA